MSDSLSTTGGNVGQGWQQTGGNLLNALTFLIRQVIAGKAFCGLVLVKQVIGGGTGTPPMALVQPLVNQIDGLGNSVPHGTIANIPCFRLQGGAGALILDPIVGDIGVAIICDRDISAVKSTGAQANPGSFRTNSWADGLYFGGFLNGGPTSYVQINSGGITMKTDGTLAFTASNGTLDASGNLTLNGDVIAMKGAAQVSLVNHLTSAVSSGTEESGPPVPGT
jgi:hypothetical protein